MIDINRFNELARKVPFLGYYRRSYSTARNGTITEYGDGFALMTIDPDDRDETRDIVIRPVPVGSVFDILRRGRGDHVAKLHDWVVEKVYVRTSGTFVTQARDDRPERLCEPQAKQSRKFASIGGVLRLLGCFAALAKTLPAANRRRSSRHRRYPFFDPVTRRARPAHRPLRILASRGLSS